MDNSQATGVQLQHASEPSTAYRFFSREDGSSSPFSLLCSTVFGKYLWLHLQRNSVCAALRETGYESHSARRPLLASTQFQWQETCLLPASGSLRLFLPVETLLAPRIGARGTCKGIGRWGYCWKGGLLPETKCLGGKMARPLRWVGSRLRVPVAGVRR